MTEEEIRKDERIKTGNAIKKLLADAIDNNGYYVWCKNRTDDYCTTYDCDDCYMRNMSIEIDELIGVTDCYELDT